MQDPILSDARGAPEQDAKLSPFSLPTPRLKIVRTETGQAIEPALDESGDLDDFRASFLAAFGTSNETVAEALFQQLLNALHSEPSKPVDSATANLALALMHEIAPKDAVEAMLATEMIVGHFAAMDTTRRALHAEQTAGGRTVYLALTRKLMALFAAQMDALNRHRGKGTTQKIVIERVLVAPGAQAIVGAVGSGRRGDER